MPEPWGNSVRILTRCSARIYTIKMLSYLLCCPTSLSTSWAEDKLRFDDKCVTEESVGWIEAKQEASLFARQLCLAIRILQTRWSMSISSMSSEDSKSMADLNWAEGKNLAGIGYMWQRKHFCSAPLQDALLQYWSPSHAYFCQAWEYPGLPLSPIWDSEPSIHPASSEKSLALDSPSDFKLAIIINTIHKIHWTQ